MKNQDYNIFDDNDPTEVFYLCDPKKAITCKKTSCYINGGECRLTTRKDWADRKCKSHRKAY